MVASLILVNATVCFVHATSSQTTEKLKKFKHLLHYTRTLARKKTSLAILRH